jgi:hypothetical protein
MDLLSFFWIMKPVLFWITLALIVSAIFVSFEIETERGFRLIGLGLQLIGILTVAFNLRGTRRQFGRPSMPTLVVQWWRQRPKFRYPPITASGAVTLAPATLDARAYVWDPWKPDATVEQRLSALERNLDRARASLTNVENSIDQNKKESAAFLERERTDRAAADNSITRKLEESQVGGLHVSAFGIACLIIGSIMSTASV